MSMRWECTYVHSFWRRMLSSCDALPLSGVGWNWPPDRVDIQGDNGEDGEANGYGKECGEEGEGRCWRWCVATEDLWISMRFRQLSLSDAAMAPKGLGFAEVPAYRPSSTRALKCELIHQQNSRAIHGISCFCMLYTETAVTCLYVFTSRTNHTNAMLQHKSRVTQSLPPVY